MKTVALLSSLLLSVPSLVSASCANYVAAGYYSSKVFKAGIPAPAYKTYVTLPTGMTPCDLEELQRYCVDRINMHRSGALKFSDGTSDPGTSMHSTSATATTVRPIVFMHIGV